MNKRICNVLKCNRSVEAKGMCNKHYQRAKAGRPLDDKPTYLECTADGCRKKPRSTHAELCSMHYHRVYRNGSLERLTLTPRWEDIRGQRFGKLIVVERDANAWLCACDCGRTTRVAAGSLNRGTLSCGTRGCKPAPTPRQSEAGYGAAHSRVRRDKGSASQHACVDCNGTAYQWSYDHDDPDERTSTERNSTGMPYSLRSEHYEPRCVRCHKAFDRAHGQARQAA